jgi:hypothetical protein
MVQGGLVQFPLDGFESADTQFATGAFDCPDPRVSFPDRALSARSESATTITLTLDHKIALGQASLGMVSAAVDDLDSRSNCSLDR